MRTHLAPVPDALTQKWAAHVHGVQQRLATTRPAAVEDAFELPPAGQLALQMEPAEAAALNPLLQRAEAEFHRELARMLARARERVAARRVFDAVAPALGATPLAPPAVLALAVSLGGGMPVHETYALVGRFEWGSPRFVLHVYVPQESEEEGAAVRADDEWPRVMLYATACGCRSPSTRP